MARKFLIAPYTDVVALIRFSASVFEVIEESIIKPRHLNSFAELTKPKAEPCALRVSKRDVTAVE